MHDKHMTYHEVREALAEPGCAICRLAVKAVSSYLSGMLWESVNDPGARGAIRAARGFCNYHTHVLAEMASSLSLAIIYEDLVGAALEDLADACSGMRRRRRRAPECPACRMRAEATRRYLDVLTAEIPDPDWRAHLEASDGLCFGHAVQACSLTQGENRAFLLEIAERKLMALKAELAEVIRKNDYRFSDEPWGSESDSPRRAALMMAGVPGGIAR
jgi:hypothetical protein